MQTSETLLKSGGETREFDFTKSDFDCVRNLIYKRAGISLNPSKQEMVYSRLARRLRANQLTSFKSYLELLEKGDTAEWEAFTNSLTTNLTAFFREEHHFPILAELAKRHKREQMSLWCSAASTGEEPYSIAMTLVEALGTPTPSAAILATDLDTNVLGKAEQGIYAVERLEKMSEERRRRFFLRGKGAQEGLVRVREELRTLISFRQLNLLDANWQIRAPFHAIFCRNVMIYFDKETQYRILEKFAPLLHPDGLLFMGHSESLHHAGDLFRLRGKTVYEHAGKKRAANG